MKPNQVLFSYFGVLLDMLEKDGIDVSCALEKANLDRSKVISSGCRVPTDQVITLLTALENRVDLLSLSLKWGSGIKIITHGDVGLAAMTAKTIDDALRISAKYITTQIPFYSVIYQQGVLRVSLHLSDISNNLRLCLLELWACAVSGAFQFLTSTNKLTAKVSFSFSQNKPMKEYIVCFGVAPLFDQDITQLEFPNRCLNYELPLHEAMSHEAALYRCEHQLATSTSSKQLAQLVSELFYNSQNYRINLEQAANQLGMSPRSLIRKLDALGTSFRDLKDKARKEAALLHITSKQKPISQIAYMLGFEDVSNFSKAFKKWTGESPSSYRRKYVS